MYSRNDFYRHRVDIVAIDVCDLRDKLGTRGCHRLSQYCHLLIRGKYVRVSGRGDCAVLSTRSMALIVRFGLACMALLSCDKLISRGCAGC
jgi:hypothetical protein